MPGFLTDAELSDRLDVILKTDDDKPRGDWWTDDQIADCNAQAWSFIAGTLQQSRRYSLAEVLQWGRAGKGYQAEVALFLLNERGRQDTGMPPGEQQADPRDRLTAVDNNGDFVLWVTADDGTLIVPALQDLVLHGRLNTTDETFRDSQGRLPKW